MRIPLVADVKRNALDDGPGVRSTVFFKGCTLACVWCHNPECVRAGPELMLKPDRCVACGACARVCPNGAVPAGGGAVVDRARCRRCGACAAECPSGAREMVGRRWAVDDLVALLLRDERIYRNSGGGVTLSGGEPALYAEYGGAVAEKLRRRGVHVLAETAGCFDWPRFEAHLLPHLDAVYVDLKIVDPEASRRWCGRPSDRILANVERLLGALGDGRVLVRIPLVPGLTATPANLDAAAAWLRARGVRRVALLAYNPLWPTKAAGVGRDAGWRRDGWMTDAEKAEARAAFEGFEVVGLH